MLARHDSNRLVTVLEFLVSKLARRAVPGAVLEVLPQCGHLLTWEQPEAVNGLLLDWLERLGTLPAPGQVDPSGQRRVQPLHGEDP